MDSASKLIDYDKYLFNKVNKSLTKRAKSILQDVFNKYDSKGKTFLTVETPQHNEEKYKIWCKVNLLYTILYTINME